MHFSEMHSFSFQSTDKLSNQVLSQDQILTEINFAGSRLEPVVKLTPGQRQLLLLKFNWDIKSLKKSFEENTDMNFFLLRHGICPKNIVTSIKKSECSICCAEGKVIGLSCKHMACEMCWKNYLTTKIKSGHSILCCMSCHLSICNETLQKFLNDRKSISAHQKLVVDSYVRNNSSLTWCNEKCGRAVRRSNSDIVLCTCGSEFCFSCGSDPHLPATCRQVQLWNKKREDNESRQNSPKDKSSSWILGNTKECPSCWAPIEKTGGCNHMACSRCHYQFCWICRQNWRTYEGNCKIYHTNAEESRIKYRSDFSTFTHYLLRFESHKQCLASERRQLPALKSTRILIECRLILMNSCVFEFFLKHGPYSESFVQNRKNLENAVEKLSKHLIEFRESRNSVSIVLAEKCREHQQTLLDYCAEGGEHEDIEGRRSIPKISSSKSWDPVHVYNFVIFCIFLLIVSVCTVCCLRDIYSLNSHCYRGKISRPSSC